MKRNLISHGRRILSIALAFVLLATTFLIFDPSGLKIKASAISYWDGSDETPNTDDLNGAYPNDLFKTNENGVNTIHIKTARGLMLYANLVKNKHWFYEWTVKLDTDIDLGGSSGKWWMGIGDSGNNVFTGTFDGQGHTVYNMYIGDRDNDRGFFRKVDGATIKNVNFDNCTVSTNNLDGVSHGVVVGWCNSNTCTFENITVTRSQVYGDCYLGGIVGAADTSVIFNNCKYLASTADINKSANTAGVTFAASTDYFVKGNDGQKSDSGVGGIIGRISTGTLTLTNCVNSTWVYMTNGNNQCYRIGGLVGRAVASTNVKDCLNFGQVGDPNNRRGLTAGMVGNVERVITLENCKNYGNVYGSDNAAGLIGWVGNNGDQVVTLSKCYNYGNIDASSDHVSGMVARNDSNGWMYITDCHNYGNVEGPNTASGIISKTYGSVDARNCSNDGTIATRSNTHAAGICAYIDDDDFIFVDCINNGDIYAGNGSSKYNCCAGILADYPGAASTGKTLYFTRCTNNGNLYGASANGGIFGHLGEKSSTSRKNPTVRFTDCLNTGNVNCYAGDGDCGGLTGNIDTDNPNYFTNCRNTGDVYSSNRYVGGIAGKLKGNFYAENCTNEGSVSGYANVAGLVGRIEDDYSTITNCVNLGNVTSQNDRTGGLIGSFDGDREMLFTNCTNKGNVTGAGNDCGGFVGYTKGVITMNRCMNAGNVKIETNSYNTAGFVGYIDDDTSTFTDCVNYGNITGRRYVGGLLGEMHASRVVTFNNCANLGNIYVTANTTDTYAGGIIAFSNGGGAVLNKCYNGNGTSNHGNIGSAEYQFSRAGGLVGWASTQVALNDCYNNGTVYGENVNNTYVGGLIAEAGNSNCSVKNSYNAGSVSGYTSSRRAGVFSGRQNVGVDNSYYLGGCCTDGFEYQGSAVDEVTLKDAAMISNYLNDGNWMMDEDNINKGYPILKGSVIFTQNITFKNYDGSVLYTKAWPYISIPSYQGATPERASDDNYQYTFKEFTPAFAEVTEDADYTATYNAIPHDYEWVSISATHHHYICKDCGYVKTNTVLNHQTVWQFADETGHWQHCTVCGYETDKTAHVLEYKSDASQHWQECTICDYATAKESHSLERLYTEDGHYDYCDTCKYTSTTVSHTLLADYDENGHWKYCSDCDYETTPVTHTLGYVADDSQHWKECSDCDYATTKVDHELTEKFDTDQHWKSCDVCGLYETTKINHSLKNAYNDDQHWQKCTGCAYETEKEDHTLSLKTYADFHRDECACGYKTNQQSHTVTVYSDDSHHWFVSDDGCGYKSAEYDHQGKQVINETQHYLYCETCTRSYNYQDHNFVLLDNVFDADTHTYKCAGCPKEKKEEHVFTDASGKCQICKYSQDDLADYTNVIAALDKVPSDNEIELFIENDANYELLKLTVASVKWNHKSAEQMTVNALAKSIEDAIDGLTIKTYPVYGLGAGKVTYKKTASTKHYMLATVTAPIQNGAGEYFSYWVNEKGEVASTYLNYTFYSVADRTLTPVYGKTLTEADYVSSYVAGVRDNLDGTHSILVEHSASQKVEINGHGVLFTYDGGKTGSLTLGSGADGVYNPVAAATASTRTGLFEVTITAPSDASNIYLKPYVTNMTTGETVYGADASFGLGGLASQSIDVLSITELTIDEDSVEPSATDEITTPETGDTTADEPITMPDYQLTIWEQIVAFILSIWKYLMSLLAF